MEPGRKGREYKAIMSGNCSGHVPQWSPAAKAGNTCLALGIEELIELPQWSPAAKAGNTSQ